MCCPPRVYSVFSIIELDFKTPFDGWGPPEYLDETFSACLTELGKEEDWGLTMWGHDLVDPNKVIIMLGTCGAQYSREASLME